MNVSYYLPPDANRRKRVDYTSLAAMHDRNVRFRGFLEVLKVALEAELLPFPGCLHYLTKPLRSFSLSDPIPLYVHQPVGYSRRLCILLEHLDQPVRLNKLLNS